MEACAHRLYHCDCDCECVSVCLNASGCGEFISSAHCLLNSLYSSEGQLFPVSLSSPPTPAPSLFYPLSLSLSLADVSFPSMQQQFKDAFIGGIEICIAKKLCLCIITTFSQRLNTYMRWSTLQVQIKMCLNQYYF